MLPCYGLSFHHRGCHAAHPGPSGRCACAVEQVNGGSTQRLVLVDDAAAEPGAGGQRLDGRHALRPVLVHLYHQLPDARPAGKAVQGIGMWTWRLSRLFSPPPAT